MWVKAVKVKGQKALVEAKLTADGALCATCRGIFIAVKPAHPAYHPVGKPPRRG